MGMIITRSWLLIMLAIAGCEPSMIALPSAKAPVEAKPLATAYDADSIGSIRGSVIWVDARPVPAPIQCPVGDNRFEPIPNPNAPKINENNRLAGAVVMLRGVDPARSKPWPFAPVEVVLAERGITVHQGNRNGRVGFAHRGDSVTFRTNGEKTFGLRARGDAFFAQILPPAQSSITRTFPDAGRVELSSASGQYWASADLYICDHPYVTMTDANGEFSIANAPPGHYELAVEYPNWNIEASEIDPETALLVRQIYAPHVQQIYPAAIEPKQTRTYELHLAGTVPPELN